jgi:hypothetical protein
MLITKACLLAALALPLAAADAKTVYVDRMQGLESFVEEALRQVELPFSFVEEMKNPELKATLRQRTNKTYAEILYHAKTGRNDLFALDLYDLKQQKVIATYEFRKPTDDNGKREVAKGFAQAVKKALAAQ